jgi:hypothetical protein
MNIPMKTFLRLTWIALAAALLAPAGAFAQNAIVPRQFSLVNASTTVPVQLTNNPAIMCNTFTIVGKVSAQGANNAATLYIGTSSTDGANGYAIASGETHVFVAPRGQSYRLSDFYIDVGSASDGVWIIYQ